MFTCNKLELKPLEAFKTNVIFFIKQATVVRAKKVWSTFQQEPPTKVSFVHLSKKKKSARVKSERERKKVFSSSFALGQI